MSLFRPGLALVVIVLGGSFESVRAAEPVVLRYKFNKGDKLIYKSVQESSQAQTFMNNKTETKTTHEVFQSRTVDDVDAQGVATLKSKAERRKLKVGDYTFDSMSSDRDTTSAVGAAVTPLMERLTGSEYSVLVNSRGNVVDVKGYLELIGDLIKDNPVGQAIVGGGAGKAGAQIAEQEWFVTLSDKAVSPGDQWERPLDVDLPGVGKLTGKIVYVYEADDKVGERKTVRIGATPSLSIELNLEAGGAKVKGTLSSGNASGTVQFDPQAGVPVSVKRSISMSGQVNVEAGGMTFPIESSQEETSTVELIDKLPE